LTLDRVSVEWIGRQLSGSGVGWQWGVGFGVSLVFWVWCLVFGVWCLVFGPRATGHISAEPRAGFCSGCGVSVLGVGITTTAKAARARPPSPHPNRCRANSAHIRQSGPESCPGVQAKVIETIQVVPSLLGSGPSQHGPCARGIASLRCKILYQEDI